MERQDLYKSSPVRFFDDIANGGLKGGALGLITAKKGVGKTSVLVQFGIDALLEGKQLVHVSFDQHSSNVITWYESIFSEIAKKKNLGDVTELRDEVIRDRTILNFNQETFTLPKVIGTLKALKEGGIKVAAIVVDGLNLDTVSAADIESVASFVKAEKITAWFSDTKAGAALNENLRAELQPYFSIVAHLAAQQNEIVLSVLSLEGKTDCGGAINLDPKTLLMCRT
ncbi:MAG: hypothetical protein IJ191_06770 [Treponema sp.]|nr:hypothetical protein [Treponema sp.]